MAAASFAGPLLTAGAALAHTVGGTPHDPWSDWSADPWIVLPLFLAGWVYVRGGSRAAAGDGLRWWRHAAFFAGLAVFYLVLQSPIEPISERVFIVHQVEHMGLRTVGPMLIMLAAPEARLIRGLPGWARHRFLAPLTGNAVVRAVFGTLAHPVGATILFVGASTFWMVPGWHDRAILDPPVHYTWHATLILTGLLFFWRVLDSRFRPPGISVPARLAMLWFAAMGNILLGAYLSFKPMVLYHAYDVLGRLWEIDAASDERFGGLTMWIPGTMMFALTGLAVIDRFRHQEERSEARRREETKAVRADAFRAGRRTGNRAIAFGILGFVAFVFVLSILVAVAYDEGMMHS